MPDTEKQELLGRLQSWLALHGKNRKDLPGLLGVSMATINGWFSKNPITPANKRAIEELIRDSTKQDPPDIRIQKAIFVDDAIGAQISEIAARLGIDDVSVLRNALKAYGEKVIGTDDSN